MSNQRFGRKQYVSPEGRKAPGKYTATQLHTFLVTDTVGGHPTDVKWAVQAYAEIAKQRRQPVDLAFTMVRDEVSSLGKWMPV